MKLILSLLLVLSLQAGPAYASFYVLDGCQGGPAGQHRIIEKQQPGKTGGSTGVCHVCCQCSQAVALTDFQVSYVAFAARQAFRVVHEGSAPEYEPTPLLEPPSHT